MTCLMAGACGSTWASSGTSVRIHDHDVVAGVVGDVADDLRVKPEVQGVQHRAHGRDGKVGLKVLGVVPHQGRDSLVAVDPKDLQRIRELCRTWRRFPRMSAAASRSREGDNLSMPA